MRLSELAGRRTVVWGLGVEGRAAARAALRAGASEVIAVADDTPGDAALATWDRAGLSEVPVTTGRAADAARRRAEVLVLSPGISRYRPEVLEAERRSTLVTNGSALFLSEHAGRTIAVTGSKGKSTVTRLVAHLLSALGRDVVAAGNLGAALLDLVGTDHLVVAEVSSYQAALVTDGPSVAVLTSLFPDHLPWHGSVERYYTDKLRLFASQDATQHGLANGADAGVRSMHAGGALANAVLYAAPGATVRIERGTILFQGVPAFPLTRSRLVGDHNAANVAGAVAVLAVAGVDVGAEATRLEAAVAAFSPLPHRLEVVASIRGVTFVDDSLATTPQAAIAACEAFPDRPLALLAGGLDRGVDYAPLVAYLEARAAGSPVVLLAMGPAGRRIAASLDGMEAQVCDDVTEAVRLGADIAGHNGVVLLSPAAASPATYGNYRHRSRAFRTGVERLRLTT